MPSSYTRLKDDDESAGKIINAIIALIMELPCFIFIYVPNGYWILCGIFLWFWFAATIGDALRQYTKPSAFWSKSSVSAILDTEIYWKIGPQSYWVCLYNPYCCLFLCCWNRLGK